MATVGQQLTAPEAGWKRFDGANSKIKYIGSRYDVSNSSAYYGTITGLNPSAVRNITIKFYGTKIRFIGVNDPNAQSDAITATIDSELVGSFSEKISPWQAQILSFEKTGLSSGIHTAVFSAGSTQCVVLDAIDIDDTGYLVLFEPTNLTATAGDAQVSLSWDVVSGAVSYTLKRSTTAGGPYTTIASGITGTSYVDTDVVNSTTYYYVVTAVDNEGHESGNSNEASATPQAPGGHGLLRITMIDSSEREYKLAMSEINGFISWFERIVGTGTTSYVLTKLTPNTKEYLAFEKIISFEVTELTE